MFGSQAENCGSKSPFPFIKWEHNLTVDLGVFGEPLRFCALVFWKHFVPLSAVDLEQDPKLVFVWRERSEWSGRLT